MTLFPRNDLCTVRAEEMKIMYAIINRTHISPIIGMIDYWLGTFQRDEYVECTSLITRLARNMGLLDRALINNIPTERVYLDYDHFFQAHMLKIDQEDDSYVMTYRGCVKEICLPNIEFWLSNVDRLTILLETTEAYNRRIASEMQVTRRMTRRQATAALSCCTSSDRTRSSRCYSPRHPAPISVGCLACPAWLIGVGRISLAPAARTVPLAAGARRSFSMGPAAA
jgi:hypothetical protein